MVMEAKTKSYFDNKKSSALIIEERHKIKQSIVQYKMN